VVFSSELVDISTMMLTDGSKFKRSFYGTCSYIPALFGLHMASVVVKDIVAEKQKKARQAKAASRASE
jgi:tRNA A37 threonylcarbamoyladenosine dehydratase